MENRLEARTELALTSPIIGVSDGATMMRVFAQRAAASSQPILLLGETGSGKDRLAEHVHELGGPGRPFVPVDCGVIPRELIETELFGYSRGAFSGSVGEKEGLVEKATDGTLFLNEIHNLSYDSQAKILRLVEKKSYRKVGSTTERRVQTRIIAGTNINLNEAMREGKFRSDLFFRLNIIFHRVPPLRERLKDIPHLAEYFIQQIEPRKRLSTTALAAMVEYDWPGNVRELYGSIARGIFNSEGQEEIDVSHIKPYFQNSASDEPQNDVVEKDFPTFGEMKEVYFLDVWKQSKANTNRAALIAGISRATMYKLKRKYNLSRGEN